LNKLTVVEMKYLRRVVRKTMVNRIN